MRLAVSKTLGIAYDVDGRVPDSAGACRSAGVGARELRLESGQRDDELTEKLRQEIARAVTDAMELADERDRELRAFVSAQLGGSVWRGAIGRGAFVIGVLLSAAANWSVDDA